MVHLAGEGIASKRWSAAQKSRILSSRTLSKSLLAESLASLKTPPKTFLSASAIGFYGDRGEETLSEASQRGGGFLADVTDAWEKSSLAVLKQEIRLVNLRFGIVLSKDGGALKQMLPPFLLGLGGRLGTGAQYMSWVSLADSVRAIEHLILNASVNGPVNIVAPTPVTNSEFTKTLGLVLHRPTFFPVPESLLRLALGEMADQLLLSSMRVLPSVLQSTKFTFLHDNLECALRDVLLKH